MSAAALAPAPPDREGAAGSFALAAAIVVAAILVAYAGVYDAPFVLDDRTAILETRDTSIVEMLRAEPTRALPNLSFLVSRRLFGEGLAAWHAGNVAVHAVNAMLLLALLRAIRRLRAPGLPAWAPAAGALLWALHPLQTGAVTYLTQRIASLAALCYFGATLCYLRSREARCGGAPPSSAGAMGWWGGAIGFAAAGLFAKENVATLPAALVLSEWLLVGRSAPDPLRVRAGLLAPFVVGTPLFHLGYLLLVKARSVAGLARYPSGIGEKAFAYVSAYQGIDFPTRKTYLLTEPGVLLRYLRLWLLPVNQVFDPLILPVTRILDARFLLPAAALAALAGAALAQARRRPLVTFGVLWFFVTIAVESSLFPLGDFYFEHRMLLPSAGLIVAALGLAEGVLARHARAGLAVTCALALVLGAATGARNRVWDDAIVFWSDNVRKAPGKLRGWINLADAYMAEDRLDPAENALLRARTIYEANADLNYNLGVVHLRRGALGVAEASLRRAIAIQPLHPEAHYNLGTILARTGRPRDAEAEFLWVQRIGKAYVPEAHYNLGVLYAAQGRIEDAVREQEAAVRGRPDLLEARHNLAVLYRRLGRAEDAAREQAVADRLRRARDTGSGLTY